MALNLVIRVRDSVFPLSGWEEKRKDGYIPVEVDCIDGNHNSGDKNNFRILCPNCHSLTGNYMFFGRKHSDVSCKKISDKMNGKIG